MLKVKYIQIGAFCPRCRINLVEWYNPTKQICENCSLKIDNDLIKEILRRLEHGIAER